LLKIVGSIPSLTCILIWKINIKYIRDCTSLIRKFELLYMICNLTSSGLIAGSGSVFVRLGSFFPAAPHTSTSTTGSNLKKSGSKALGHGKAGLLGLITESVPPCPPSCHREIPPSLTDHYLHVFRLEPRHAGVVGIAQLSLALMLGTIPSGAMSGSNPFRRSTTAPIEREIPPRDLSFTINQDTTAQTSEG
jgi:hypothetical protein